MGGEGRRRYQVLSTLGRGGFGTVYRAQLLGDGGFRKAVALKVLSDGLPRQAELARRLRDEARILGQLGHRAVVRVDDLVELDGRWTVVMELVHGVDLDAVVNAGGMPPRPALELAQEVASALHAAWSAPGLDGAPLKIVHRDIKPANLLLGAAGEVKVLDFGIARAEFRDREAVTHSVGFGSPEYMSPERLEWQTGPEGDVYALGVVLYEVLTGHRLGMSSGHPGRHQARVDQACGQLRERLGPGNDGIVSLIGTLLAYDPEARPSARQLERALDPLITGAAGPRLRDWAEERVPLLLAARPPVEGDVSEGRVLVESSSAASPTLFVDLEGGGAPTAAGPTIALELESAVAEGTPAPAPARGRPTGLWVALGAAALIGLGALLFWPGSPHAPPPVSAPVEAAPAPAPETPTVAEPVAVQADLAVAPPVATSPAPAAPAPRPASGRRTSPETGAVAVSGDAERVVLQAGGRSLSVPGEIPVGTYEVLVTFPGREPMPSGSVTVLEGTTLTLACSSSFKRCNQR